ncbi:MAG: DoxX family membrane protein [Bacteroidales bacterium]
MKSERFDKLDRSVTAWMAGRGLTLLRWSIGLIFLWFGLLKYFEGLSPAQDLAIKTISIVTFGLIPDALIIYGLATLEVLIGLGLIFNIFMRITLLLLFFQMAGTFLPVFLLPGEVFNVFPYSLSLEGQYIVKNIVIISAGILLGATVRGDNPLDRF